MLYNKPLQKSNGLKQQAGISHSQVCRWLPLGLASVDLRLWDLIFGFQNLGYRSAISSTGLLSSLALSSRCLLSLLLNAGNTSLVCLRAPQPHAWPRTWYLQSTQGRSGEHSRECHPRRPLFGRRIILNWLFLRNFRQKENWKQSTSCPFVKKI